MKNIVKNSFSSLRDSFLLVQGNARAIVITQPIWALAYNLFYPFLSLYMYKVGCSMVEIGLINAIGLISGAILGLFAGWITDRLGRCRVTLIADMMSWAVSCLIWGLARNPAWFIVGSLTSAFGRLNVVSWNCALAEGTPPEHRLNSYWWLNIVGTVAIFATPLMSLLLIKPLTLVPAMRWVMLCSSAALFVSYIIRYKMMTELPIGLEKMKTSRKESPFAALAAYLRMFKLLKGNRMLLLIIAMRTLYYLQAGIKGTYMSITVVNGLGFTSAAIGTMSLVTGIVMLLAQVLLLPKLRSLPPNKTLFVGMSILAASNLMMALSPAGNMPLLMLSTVTLAAGTIVSALLVDTGTANALPDADRATMIAFMTIVMVVLSAPFMWLGGWLAGLPGVGPRLPMVLTALLTAVGMVLVLFIGRLERQNTEI